MNLTTRDVLAKMAACQSVKLPVPFLAIVFNITFGFSVYYRALVSRSINIGVDKASRLEA